MLIRRERPDDAPAVRAVHQAAFERPEFDGTDAPEAWLVDELRADEASIAALARSLDTTNESSATSCAAGRSSMRAHRWASARSGFDPTPSGPVWARR